MGPNSRKTAITIHTNNRDKRIFPIDCPLANNPNARYAWLGREIIVVDILKTNKIITIHLI
jgi:hypothetical protein